jgi:hypothetical protein
MNSHDVDVAEQTVGEHCDCFDIFLIVCKALILLIVNTEVGAESFDTGSSVLIDD